MVTQLANLSDVASRLQQMLEAGMPRYKLANVAKLKAQGLSEDDLYGVDKSGVQHHFSAGEINEDVISRIALGEFRPSPAMCKVLSVTINYFPTKH